MLNKLSSLYLAQITTITLISKRRFGIKNKSNDNYIVLEKLVNKIVFTGEKLSDEKTN